MTDEEAQWVRDNVWTLAMRKTHREVSEHHSACGCESGLTAWCQEGRHDRCHRATGLVSCETYITNKATQVLYFPQPYTHPSVSATGAHHTRAAMVWLADRRCAWQCPCPCHSAPSFKQDTLFDLSASK